MHGKRNKTHTNVRPLAITTVAFFILFLGLGFIILFVNFSSQQNNQSIDYVLQGISRQFDESIKYIEEGIISIRHNAELREFLLNKKRANSDIEKQFSYCMDLYSDRNQNEASDPFVMRSYLFNNNHKYISIRYFPETISTTERVNQMFSSIEKDFSESNLRYEIYEGSQENTKILFMRIFDFYMEPVGICAVELNLDTMAHYFAPIEAYAKSSWLIGYVPIDKGSTPSELVSYGVNTPDIDTVNSLAQTDLSEDITTGKLVQRCFHGFGIYSIMMVSKYNVLYAYGGSFITLVIILLIIIILLGYNAAYLFRQTYQRELLTVKTEVKYLQSQLNPHFQYNILAMLSFKAKKAGNESLSKSLKAYSGLIRGKIFRGAEVFVTLEDELSLVRFYLQLQEDRFGDKLTYNIEYNPESLAKCRIPKLIIEPLVENAVEHGIEPKEGPGSVTIDVTANDNILRIMVIDDGVGFEEGKTEKRTGTSLENTKQLLQVLYPGKHEFLIKDNEHGGTTIEIRIPREYD